MKVLTIHYTKERSWTRRRPGREWLFCDDVNYLNDFVYGYFTTSENVTRVIDVLKSSLHPGCMNIIKFNISDSDTSPDDKYILLDHFYPESTENAGVGDFLPYLIPVDLIEKYANGDLDVDFTSAWEHYPRLKMDSDPRPHILREADGTIHTIDYTGLQPALAAYL